MGRFEDGDVEGHARCGDRRLLPRERRQRAGAGQGRQRRRPAGGVRQRTASTFDDIDVFYLAGGFGRHLRVEAAQRIGLIPNIPADRRSSRSATPRSKARRWRCCRGRSAPSWRRWCGGSSTAGSRRIRGSSISSSTAASSSRVESRHAASRGGADDRARRRPAGGAASSRPSTSGCSAIRADTGSKAGPRRWPTEAEAWYAEHGRPWIYAREASTLTLDADGVRIDGRPFRQRAPAPVAGRRRGAPRGAGRGRRRARARSGSGAAVAGREAGRVLLPRGLRLRRRRAPGDAGRRPPVRLGRDAAAWRCCRTTARAIRSGTSPSSRGCSTLLLTASAAPLPGPLEVLDSGMLRPKKSLLAVFGLTAPRRAADAPARPRARASAARSRRASTGGRRIAAARRDRRRARSTSRPPTQSATTPLRRQSWIRPRPTRSTRRRCAAGRAERLTLTPRDDGTIDALFRYEGTTCTNMGRPLRFDYHVQLGPRDDGLSDPRPSAAGPAADDTGYTHMCRYISDRRRPDRRRRPGHAARRRAARRGHRLDTAGVVGRLLLRRRQPRPQVGPGARNDSLRARRARTGPHRRVVMKTPLLDIAEDAPAARRRRHGHAAHARRPRAGRLRRGVEPDAPRQGARHPAPLRRGRLRLHHHQHLRRLADHAQPPRPRRRRRRGEQAPRSRSRARRSAASRATCSATSARSAA